MFHSARTAYTTSYKEAKKMARCEDYPCCGHTDGLPCDWKPPDYRNDPHALCDHEAGYCELFQYGDYDDDDEGELAAWASTQPPDNFVNTLKCGHEQDAPVERNVGETLICPIHGPQKIIDPADPPRS
jgi:hypothetical protein